MPRRYPIGPTLMAAFVVAALLPALMVSWLLSTNSTMSTQTLAENAMSQAAHRVDVGALAHLGESHTVLNALVPPFKVEGREAERARNWIRDPKAFEHMAFALTQQSPNVPYLYAGREDGHFTGVERENRGMVVREIEPGEPGRRQYLISEPGDRSHLELIESTLYDPRERPWYPLAERTGRRVFTNVYRSAVKQQFDLTLAHPVFEDDGQTLVGVIAVDMSLARLTELLSSTRISEHAVTYLVDNHGLFVASSVDEELSVVENGRHRRISPMESRDPLVRTSYEQLRAQPSSPGNTAPGLIRLSPLPRWWNRLGIGESPLIALKRPFGAKYNLDWQLIVVAPERDFTWPVIRARQWALGGMVAVIALCAVAALLVARGLSRQFEKLNASASALGAGDIPPVQEDAPLREVEHLSRVMHDSALKLQDYNREIRLKNEQLEQAALLLEERVRQRTAELAASREEALAAVRAKAGFLAVMSHEIRTPLNGVMGMSELLTDTPLTETQRDLFKVLRLSCEQLQSVVGDILDFSRIEAGRLELEKRPFDLHAAIGHCIQMVQLAASEKGLGLNTHVADDVPKVIVGDVTRLRQVLLNLLSNAIKFTHAGGVTLDVVTETPATDGTPRLRFTVTDTGVGIRPERQEQIFQPFDQGDTSTTRLYGGTGLGLAICRHLVALMRGSIVVSSEPGFGASFSFDIAAPAADDDALHEGEMPSLLPPAAPGLRVLVVDDNAINRRVTMAMLERLGHACAMAEDGHAAIAALRAADSEGQPFTHVLLDRHMPGLDGLATARAILSQWGGRAPQLIGISASTFVEDRQRCLDAGMNGYLPKPLQLAALARALNQTAAGEPAGAGSDSEETTPARTLPWLDPARLDEFRDIDDAEGSLRRDVTRLFLHLLDDLMPELAESARTGDSPRFAQLAHRLAGAASNIGAARMAQVCLQAEHVAKAGPAAENLSEHLHRIGSCVEPTRQALLSGSPA